LENILSLPFFILQIPPLWQRKNPYKSFVEQFPVCNNSDLQRNNRLQVCFFVFITSAYSKSHPLLIAPRN